MEVTPIIYRGHFHFLSFYHQTTPLLPSNYYHFIH